MEFPRASGVLLHITSLPSQYGIGDLGPGAFRFVEFLQAAGQQIWQILPLGPTIRGDSPYSCYSAFAGNPLLISPDELLREGWLSSSDLDAARPTTRSQSASLDEVDYLDVTEFKWKLLRLACERFFASPVCAQVDRFEDFCVRHRWWLDDFALYAALMKHFGTDQWDRWDADLVRREPAALQRLAPGVGQADRVRAICSICFLHPVAAFA